MDINNKMMRNNTSFKTINQQKGDSKMPILTEEYQNYHNIYLSICKKCRNDQGKITIEVLTEYFRTQTIDELLMTSNTLGAILEGLQEALNEKYSRVSNIVMMDEEVWDEDDNYDYFMDEDSFMDNLLGQKKMLNEVIHFLENKPSMHREFLPLLALIYIWLGDHKDCFIIDAEGEEISVEPCSKLDPFDYFPCHKLAPYHWVEN